MYENRLLCVEVQYPSDGVRILKRYPFRENQTFTIAATEEADGRLLTVRMYDLRGTDVSAIWTELLDLSDNAPWKSYIIDTIGATS